MKSYVITINEIEQSVQAAKRCINSGLSTGGIIIEKFNAVTPKNTDIHAMAEEEGINIDGFKEIYSRLDNCLAAFLSHYSIWKLAAESHQPTAIFEHDAVIVNNINSSMVFNKVVNIGKPSYGNYNTPNTLGVGPLVHKPYFGGAHAYIINRDGAKELIKQAKIEARPTDVFLNVNNFPFLQEKYPWPVEARDSFTTIQKEMGCLAKHNYGETYEIL